MLRSQRKIRNMIMLTIFSFLLISIGYATITTNLSINGSLAIDKVTWDVHYENIRLNKNNTVSATPVLGNNDTTLTYSVNLAKPGDFYSFTVDVVNDGTIDAMISTISATGLTNEQKDYINYSLTYSDGEDVSAKDSLMAGYRERLVVTVEYKYDVNTLLDDPEVMSLTLNTTYVQDDGTSIKRPLYYSNLIYNSALTDSAINFGAISSASNGRGLYLMSGTTNDDYPIYYYRGNVSNNNAKFAGFCWKIVRTTETGGTKLVYNGTPNGSGQCVNTTGDATQLSSTSAFNANSMSAAYAGYMYGTVYPENHDRTVNSSYSYGNAFEFVDVDENVSGDGTYTLTDTVTDTSQITTHHYTCFNDTGTCSQLYYIYYLNGTTAYYIILKDGKSVEDALREMQTNTNNSTIKTAVDNWFNNTFKTYFTTNEADYNDYLEDTIWCNDRSMNKLGTDNSIISNGWNPNGGSVSNYLYFSGIGRLRTFSPSLECSNKNDSFTVEESETGNGALTYPVGLLTADEAWLAGGQNSSNSDFYLYTNSNWYTMTPRYFYGYFSYMFGINYAGDVGTNLDHGQKYFGVRPSISINGFVKISAGGDGSSTSPYEFIVD